MISGEPITYVTDVANERGRLATGAQLYRKGLARSHVDEVLSYEVFLVQQNGSPFLGREGEGVSWVRGHHTEQSEVGQALLAAYALSRSVAA